MLTGLPEVLDDLHSDDPRLGAEFCWYIPADGTDREVVLVGVAHDHPASCYRVRAIADTFEPDFLGLELPPLAVPAFEPASNDDTAVYGDEMSEAIAVAPGAAVVGIDSLGWTFARRFVRNARAMTASLGTVRDAVGEVSQIARHAIACRLGTAGTGKTATDDHSRGAELSPAEQAADERTQVSRSRSLLNAIERPRADLLVDETREDTMASNIASLRRDGTVLAVVGMDHLETLAEALDHSGEDD